MTRLRRCPVPVAPLAEQREIARLLNACFTRVAALLDAVQVQSAALSSLNASILAKAFRGGLVLQNPNAEPASVLLKRIRAERTQAGGAPKRRGRSPSPR